MKIIPKIDENWVPVNGPILTLIKKANAVEIQMLNKISIYMSFIHIQKQIDELPYISHFILHLPFGFHALEYLACNSSAKLAMKRTLESAIRLSESKNISIDFIIHAPTNYHDMIGMGSLDFLMECLAQCKNSKVSILIENGIRSIELGDQQKTAFEEIPSYISHPNLKYCLDLCHWKASENWLELEIMLPEKMIPDIKQIHFAQTRNNDGYREKRKTHGKVHDSYKSFCDDIEYLIKKGIDFSTTNLVLEICEDDYKTRHDLLKEIEYANQYLI